MNTRNRFTELRDEVVDLLKRSASVMENVVPHLGDESASSPKTFQERANTVQNEEFVVVVVGEMNRGKSMLLNAMMHKQLLTTDTLECTATVNFLRHPKLEKDQSPDRVEVHFTNGKPLEKVPVEKLADYTSRGSKEVADLVDHVDVFVESRFLKDNVLLVDTPGTNTTTHNHIRITNEQIERSNAAIFLFDAETQMTRSDREFLESVKESVSRLFFVANKIDDIDKNDIDRVLERVESGIHGVVEQSEQSEVRVFGLSGAKALLGRTGYVKNPILAENERDKLDDAQFRRTLIEESQINAFEEALEQYLFQGGKAYDLLHSPLSFIQGETAKLIGRLHRQIEVLDDTFDLSDLEIKIEKVDRTVGDRKRKLEGMTDELSAELSEALSEAQRTFEGRCGLAEEALKDELNSYDSREALEDNWKDGVHLADLPGRSFAALERQASKLLQDAIGRVLRKQTREIRRQVQGELGVIALELPEMPEMVLQLQAARIDKAEEDRLKKSEREIEDIDRQLEELDDAREREVIDRRRYEELREERQQLSEEHHSKLQFLGSRPEARVRTVTEEKEEDVRGIGGFLAYLARGKKRIQIPGEIVDDQDRKEYEKRLASIEKKHEEKQAELDSIVKELKVKIDAELLARRKAEKLEELRRNFQEANEKAEREYQEKLAGANRRATESTKGQLISTFQRAVETLKAAVEHSVGQTENMATDFIENAIDELDATLKAHNQELAKLQSLKEVKESERDTAKEGITRAIEELKALQETATHLDEKHKAFVDKPREEK